MTQQVKILPGKRTDIKVELGPLYALIKQHTAIYGGNVAEFLRRAAYEKLEPWLDHQRFVAAHEAALREGKAKFDHE